MPKTGEFTITLSLEELERLYDELDSLIMFTSARESEALQSVFGQVKYKLEAFKKKSGMYKKR